MEKDKIISIKNLNKSYGKKEVLKDINLDVYKGQIIGYIGPNGAGKSTTVKIMLGIINDYGGTVEIFNENISNGNVDYKKRIGYVPEISEIYESLTPREYLTFIGELYGLDYEEASEKAFKLVKLLNLHHVFDSRMNGFSKGMKQKVIIVSSLLHNPDILFLDEPLNGLDANSVMIVKEILSQLVSKGKTIFYSSHIMDVVEKISNRIILLNNGEIIADGSFKELQSKSHEGSLEEVFNELTGFEAYKDIANEFISIIEGENKHEIF